MIPLTLLPWHPQTCSTLHRPSTPERIGWLTRSRSVRFPSRSLADAGGFIMLWVPEHFLCVLKPLGDRPEAVEKVTQQRGGDSATGHLFSMCYVPFPPRSSAEGIGQSITLS